MNQPERLGGFQAKLEGDFDRLRDGMNNFLEGLETLGLHKVTITIEAHPLRVVTRGELFDYLSQHSGGVFEDDLVKHFDGATCTTALRSLRVGTQIQQWDGRWRVTPKEAPQTTPTGDCTAPE